MRYKRLLLPTDGSAISKAAARAGVEFAKEFSADIVGLFVAPEFPYPNYAPTLPLISPTEDEYKASMREAGETYLKEIQNAATAAGLQFTGITVFSEATAEQIVQAAEENGCDLIFMGSHGRSGARRLLLGSVTSKVLALCQIPVLVYRLKPGSVH